MKDTVGLTHFIDFNAFLHTEYLCGWGVVVEVGEGGF